MNVSANSLFHITPKLEYLLNILENGFHPRYCIEEIGFFTPFTSDDEMFAQPMICFCDIPLSSIKEHMEKYGHYGIGVRKDWGIKNAISPVTYVYPHSATGDLIRLISFKSLMLLVEDKHDQFLGLTQILKNYFKAIKGRMYKDGKFGSVEYNFYNEREWRYVPFGIIEKLYNTEPRVKTFLEKREFDDLSIRDVHNSIMSEQCALKFQPSDIKYLFVKNDADFEFLVNYIENNYAKNNALSDVRSLVSKIQILEHLMQDL